jgi:hypothetical protein
VAASAAVAFEGATSVVVVLSTAGAFGAKAYGGVPSMTSVTVMILCFFGLAAFFVFAGSFFLLKKLHHMWPQWTQLDRQRFSHYL